MGGPPLLDKMDIMESLAPLRLTNFKQLSFNTKEREEMFNTIESILEELKICGLILLKLLPCSSCLTLLCKV